MKLAVVAANGRVAGKVIAEALNRGLERRLSQCRLQANLQ